MARLIDADALADELAVLLERNTKLIDEWLANLIEDAVDDAPTVDAEPVIRCDDCIYRDGNTPGQPNILCWQMHSDDYCSYGTKREVGTYCENIVSVVRCKDCKWHYILNGHNRCDLLDLEARDIKPDWFCADGERREDADK